MGFDVNGSIIALSGSELDITTGGSPYLRITSTGIVRKNAINHPLFVAGGSVFGPNSIANNTWTVLIHDTATWNYGSCYSISTGRFTAPVAGNYLFSGNIYGKGWTAGDVSYAAFFVNGSQSSDYPCAYGAFNTEYYGVASGGFSMSADLTQVIKLGTGDYVTHDQYWVSANAGWYPIFSTFQGTLLA